MIRWVLLLLMLTMAGPTGCALLEPHREWQNERLNSRIFPHELIVTVREAETGLPVADYPIAFVDWKCADRRPGFECHIASIHSGVILAQRIDRLDSGYTDKDGRYSFSGLTSIFPGAYLGVINNFYASDNWSSSVSCFFAKGRIRTYEIELIINLKAYNQKRDEHVKYYRMHNKEIEWEGEWPRAHDFVAFRPGKDVCPRRRADASEAE